MLQQIFSQVKTRGMHLGDHSQSKDKKAITF